MFTRLKETVPFWCLSLLYSHPKRWRWRWPNTYKNISYRFISETGYFERSWTGKPLDQQLAVQVPSTSPAKLGGWLGGSWSGCEMGVQQHNRPPPPMPLNPNGRPYEGLKPEEDADWEVMLQNSQRCQENLQCSVYEATSRWRFDWGRSSLAFINPASYENGYHYQSFEVHSRIQFQVSSEMTLISTHA